MIRLRLSGVKLKKERWVSSSFQCPGEAHNGFAEDGAQSTIENTCRKFLLEHIISNHKGQHSHLHCLPCFWIHTCVLCHELCEQIDKLTLFSATVMIIEVNGIGTLVANQRKMEDKAESDTETLCQNPNDSLTKTQLIPHDYGSKSQNFGMI